MRESSRGQALPDNATVSLLHLASASVRRRDILSALGVRHTWAGVDIDESPQAGESPANLALRLAVRKVRTARDRDSRSGVILGADTVVSLDERIFGKPASRDDALRMLLQLSGRLHVVKTAVVVSVDGKEFTALSSTEVRFRRFSAHEACAYWASGEPAGKAGAYAVQGLGGIFVESLSGSYSGVVGLPVYETAILLQQAGMDLLPDVPPQGTG
ncbi:MAG: nucleoside triphosphate pyrophosphatase [Woeseia sp.]